MPNIFQPTFLEGDGWRRGADQLRALQERHPTAQARFKLVIEDIVEYGILGTGKLVFYFGDDDTEHALPTVLFVHKKAKRLDDLLGRIEVVSRR